jgi:hypothetical protein
MATQEPASRFFSLPKEIRDMIYKQIQRDADVYLAVHHEVPFRVVSKAYIPRNGPFVGPRSGEEAVSNITAIRQVCRQINNEWIDSRERSVFEMMGLVRLWGDGEWWLIP